MTTELLIRVMPEEWCGFQHSKYSSNCIRRAIAFKLYSTGHGLKFIYWLTEEVFEYQTKKLKSLTLPFQVAAMCCVKYTSSLFSCVCTALVSSSCRACIHVIAGRVRIRVRLFTLLYADCIFHIETRPPSWSPFSSAVCHCCSEKEWILNQAPCALSIAKPTRCRGLDNIVRLSVLHKRSVHAPENPIQGDHPIEMVSSRQKLTELFTTKWCHH